MQKKTKLIAGLTTSILLMVLLISCKKEQSVTKSSLGLIDKVNFWLDKKKPNSKPKQAASVEFLKNSLDFTKMETDLAADRETIVTIPISDQFKTAKNIGNATEVNLVVLVDAQGNIRKGNIVIYTAEPGQSDADNSKQFLNLYKNGDNVADGKYKFLAVTGHNAYELEYDNNRLKRLSHPKDSTATANRGNNCVDWYWVTTWYDEYGNILSQDWEYWGTTCQGEDCEDPYFAMLCPMDHSGAGSGPDMGYEYADVRTHPWTVGMCPSPTPSNNWRVESREFCKGVRNQNEPFGGHFTEVEHTTSVEMLNLGWGWTQNSANAQVVSGSQAYFYVIGHLNYVSHQEILENELRINPRAVFNWP